MIVGVHGIAQQQGGPNQLTPLWQRSLADGIQFAGGPRRAQVPLKLAFYGHLFLRHAPGLGGSEEDDLTQCPDDELAWVVAAVAEVLTPEEIAEAEALPPALGYTRTPRPIQVLLRALDARFGPAAGILYLGALRQVHRYLHDEPLKAAVDEVVATAVTADCRILVAHSLGSVVALEYVRQHPEHQLDLLLMLGSPLGLRMVQVGLPVMYFGSRARQGIPDSVKTWVNIRDVRDPVACAGDLARWWPGVEDRQVDNEGDAHNVTRYLSKYESGEAVLGAAPQL